MGVFVAVVFVHVVFRVALCCKIWPNSKTMTGLSLMTNMLRLAVNTLRLRTTMEEPCVLIQISVFPKGQDIGEWYYAQQYFTKASSQKARSQWNLKNPKNHWTLQKENRWVWLFFCRVLLDLQTTKFWDPRILREGIFRWYFGDELKISNLELGECFTCGRTKPKSPMPSMYGIFTYLFLMEKHGKCR